jgi:hypothetical protein
LVRLIVRRLAKRKLADLAGIVWTLAENADA